MVNTLPPQLANALYREKLQRARLASAQRVGKQVIAHNEKRDRLYEVVGDTVHLYLHPGQWRAWESERRIIAMVAGSQGGKTSFGPWWLYSRILRRGTGDYIAATATYDLLKLKMLLELRTVFEDVLKIGRYWKGDKVMEIADPVTGKFLANYADDPMYARIILRAASASGGLESLTGKDAWLDEFGQDSVPLDAYEAVQRRLTLNQGSSLLTTTPYNMGWLKQQIVDRADFDPDIDLIQFESIENPAFPQAEFDRLRATMPEWKFNLFHRGLFTRPPGMIYSDFINEYRDSGGHKVKPFEVPAAWPRFVGIDPGANNMALVWLAHDPDADIYYLYRESLDGKKATAEHAHDAAALAKRHNERVIRWFMGQKSEAQARLDWAAGGLRNVFEPPFADVEAGIDKVIGLLREYRLYIFDTCTGVLDEIGRYSRKLDDSGQVTEVIRDKQTFHRMDALRYAAVGVTAGIPTVRMGDAPKVLVTYRGG